MGRRDEISDFALNRGPRFGDMTHTTLGQVRLGFEINLSGASPEVEGLKLPKRQEKARRLDVRMVFVPEGQHDSSQARSA
jgi:hypothetical protein